MDWRWWHDGSTLGTTHHRRPLARVTRAGAYAGLIGGITTFVILHAQLIEPNWFGPGFFFDAATWLYGEGPNPYSCAVMGEIVSVSLTFIVSKLTQPLPEDHLSALFQGSEA